ncbi:MAG: hypothetical protein AAFO81_10845 [Pseudomonadota bacterium]
MDTCTHRTVKSALALVIALAGTWHASLLANETQPQIDEIRAEIISDASLNQTAVIANNVSVVAERTNDALLTELLLELDIKFDNPRALVIANND